MKTTMQETNKMFLELNPEEFYGWFWNNKDRLLRMEKEQMRNASCPYVGGWEDDEFDYWYNEKYGNNEKI